MAEVLFVKPGAIRARDRKALSDAGVVVVEIENPADAKFTRAGQELPHGALLVCAMHAILANTYVHEVFGKAVAEAIINGAHHHG
jgi:hypothetical protein